MVDYHRRATRVKPATRPALTVVRTDSLRIIEPVPLKLPPPYETKPASRNQPGLFIGLGAGVLLAAALLLVLLKPARRTAPEITLSEAPADSAPVTAVVVQLGEIMPFVLRRAGISNQDADRIIAGLRAAGFDFRAMRPGDSLMLAVHDSDRLQLFYRQSAELVYRIDLDSGDCRIGTLLLDVRLEPGVVSGEITSSLYQALLDAGEKPGLIADYTDIFGWEVDFFSETQAGDSFRILLQRKFVDSRLVGYGPILAARYKGTVGDFVAFRFTDPEGHTDYYNAEGQSLRKTFLKSPLRFSRISSYFGNRRHPILGVRRMHHGLDYVAPTGTPVSCVADGRVLVAAWSGGYGRLVEVGHGDGYVTRYGHLSRFGKGIRQGVAVKQGEIIGYVGSTGLSTGPHLHYEVRKHGATVNPLRLDPPRAAPVKLAFVSRFEAVRDSLVALERSLPR
ncbi:MAG: M23 family metallopeptidase [candidate division WOR-3 bacterium]